MLLANFASKKNFMKWFYFVEHVQVGLHLDTCTRINARHQPIQMPIHFVYDASRADISKYIFIWLFYH